MGEVRLKVEVAVSWELAKLAEGLDMEEARADTDGEHPEQSHWPAECQTQTEKGPTRSVIKL